MVERTEMNKIPSYFMEEIMKMGIKQYEIILDGLSQEKISVDAKDLANMTVTEWYLIVLEPEESDEINNEYFNGTLNAGFSEIVSRGVESIDAYMWGMVNITEEDGSLLKVKRDVFDEYIFKIESVDIPEGKPPILRGNIVDYSTDSNHVGTLEKLVIIQFAETPTFKQNLGYIPL